MGLLVERVESWWEGPVDVEWMVPPPDEGQAYRVTREEWDDSGEVPRRRIFEWEPAERPRTF